MNSDATEHSTMVSDRADESQVVSPACAVQPQSRVCEEEQTVTLWLLVGRGQPDAEALHGASGALSSWKEFWDLTHGCSEFGASRSIFC